MTNDEMRLLDALSGLDEAVVQEIYASLRTAQQSLSRLQRLLSRADLDATHRDDRRALSAEYHVAREANFALAKSLLHKIKTP